MSDHSHDSHDISKQVKIYITVFVALLVGTIVTVGLNYMHFESMALTISIALFVAIIKAGLVACYFMHLISERKLIYGVLAFTVFFFAGLMCLMLWAHGDPPLNTVVH
jgi:caa(3)-type oxidase subunit IV